MALAGRLRRGVRLQVWTPTTTRGADGVRAQTFAAGPVLDARLEAIGAETAHRLFGTTDPVTLQAFVPLAPALPDEARVSVLTGPLAGLRCRVRAVTTELGRPRQAHRLLALQETTEVFG